MFASASLKLTAWYLAILMLISIVFSVVIYQIAASEVDARLHGLQQTLERDNSGYILPQEQAFLTLRAAEAHKAATNLLLGLVYANILVFVAGGVGAFWLANRSLRPIEQAHEAQARFVSDASHELRTPLAVMQAELELALRQPSLSPKETKAVLSSTLEEVIKMANLSQTLLQLSKIDPGEIEMQRFDLKKTVHSVITRYDPSGKRLALRSPKQPLYIHANPVTIEELITILVDNALKYSPESSAVDLKLSRNHGRAIFTITNQGAGIPPEKLPHIFERFYRVDVSRSVSGAGLGLALAERIVSLNGGNLTAKSDVNKPTTFTLSLALASKKS